MGEIDPAVPGSIAGQVTDWMKRLQQV